MSYWKLDPNLAKGVSQAQWIVTSGAYVGTIKAVYEETTKNGAKQFIVQFVADDGQKAIVKLSTQRANGEAVGFTVSIVHSLMTACKVKELKDSQGQYLDIRDGQTKLSNELHPEFTDKRVGLVIQIQPEEYLDKGTVKISHRQNILFAYDPVTKLSSTEILNRVKTPKEVDARIATLKDRPLKKLPGQPPTSTRPTGEYNAASASAEEFDQDDVPF